MYRHVQLLFVGAGTQLLMLTKWALITQQASTKTPGFLILIFSHFVSQDASPIWVYRHALPHAVWVNVLISSRTCWYVIFMSMSIIMITFLLRYNRHSPSECCMDYNWRIEKTHPCYTESMMVQQCKPLNIFELDPKIFLSDVLQILSWVIGFNDTNVSYKILIFHYIIHNRFFFVWVTDSWLS